MKKFLNGLGVFGSVVLTIILTSLIFVYAILVNVKSVVSKNGITKTFQRIDIVETLKSAEDGTVWEDFKQLGDNLGLSEKQFEQILDSEKVKEEVGSYLGEVVNALTNDKEVVLTKEKMDKFLTVAVDEYNKVSDTKISETQKQEIINSFDEEMIANMNEEFGSINLQETVDSEYVPYIHLVDNILFGNYTLILFMTIIIIIGLIVLFRFSYYKWMPYVRVSTIVVGSLMLAVGALILIIPLQDMEILLPIKNILATNIFLTSGILFIISTGLSVGKKYLKKHIENKKESVTEEKYNEEVNVVEVKDNKPEKNNKNKFVIIGIILILILIILLLIFGRKGSYTITFDTDGGTEISSIEVKNGEVVTLPNAPIKEGHTFIGWTNEDGQVLTKGAKIKDDVTLKAEWISNDAETITAEFDTDDGNETNDVVIEKGKLILLPIEPTREGYIFVGWLDGNGNIVTNNMIVTNNITLKAMWIKKGTKTVTLKVNIDGVNEIGNIIIEKGTVIMLPINPTKTGYAFAGWVDEDGNVITKDSIVDKNTTIKATWKEPYTCASDCIPIGDGSQCTKTTTTDLVVYTGCPSGTETVERFCSAHKRQVIIGFDEDQTIEYAGILCSENSNNFCVDYNGRYTTMEFNCPSGYFQYTQSDSGLDAVNGCAKKYDKGGSSCPSGYTKDGNKCIRTEIINCTEN